MDVINRIYEEYKHLDYLMDRTDGRMNFQDLVMRDLWRAIKQHVGAV